MNLALQRKQLVIYGLAREDWECFVSVEAAKCLISQQRFMRQPPKKCHHLSQSSRYNIDVPFHILTN